MIENIVVLTSVNKPIPVKAGVYLNNTRFTDPQARYYVVQRDGGYFMGTINQNTAPSGWSYISYTISKNYSTLGGFSLYGISLSQLGIGSGYTGADAIKVEAYVD